jgi:hypothetical protein
MAQRSGEPAFMPSMPHAHPREIHYYSNVDSDGHRGGGGWGDLEYAAGSRAATTTAAFTLLPLICNDTNAMCIHILHSPTASLLISELDDHDRTNY